jgi:hypothetical protein
MFEERAALFDEWTRDYALLSLRMDRLAPGTVDAWTGPASWREAVSREPVPTPSTLRTAAADLLNRLPGCSYAPTRAAYLSRQVTALETSARLLKGDALDFAEQARLLFDINVRQVPEEQFASVLEEMDSLFPGSGTLAERVAACRRRLRVAPERLPELLVRVLAELRARIAARVRLPEGEQVEMALVQHQPWSGYNWYLGEAHSRVEINTDLPVHVHDLVDLAAHEGYPGHHTEHALRETVQFLGLGQAEYAVQLINTPECVISEGLATCARGLAFPDDTDLAWTADHLLPAQDPQADMRQIAALRRLGWIARAARGNAALLLHQRGQSPEEVSAYLQRWALLAPEEAAKALEFIASPLWRTYTFTYTYGHTLLEPLLQGEDRFAVFTRVCQEPVYPSLLLEWAR